MKHTLTAAQAHQIWLERPAGESHTDRTPHERGSDTYESVAPIPAGPAAAPNK